MGANRRQLVVAEFARARARTVDALNVLVPPIGSAERRPTNKSLASAQSVGRDSVEPIPAKRRRVLGRRGMGRHSRKSPLPVERHQESAMEQLLISRRRNPVV